MIGPPYILYLTSLGLVKGPKQTLWGAYNIRKDSFQAKNEQKLKKNFLTLPYSRFVFRFSEHTRNFKKKRERFKLPLFY